MHFNVEKTLKRGTIYIQGDAADYLFYSLRLVNGYKTSDGLKRGLFVRGKVTVFYNVGGFLKIQGRQMGWRTMTYEMFKKHCDVVEGGGNLKTAGGGGEEGGARLDKYVSNRFHDNAMNIEYENLCAANESLRLE